MWLVATILDSLGLGDAGGGESKVIGGERVKEQRGQVYKGFLCGSETTYDSW